MSIYFEKARELGTLMLESEQGLRLSDAKAAFDNDASAQTLFEEFKNYQQNVNVSIQEGAMNEEQHTKASQIIMEKASELKKNPVIGELLTSENEFYAFINQVLGVIKATITGSVQEEAKGCGGSGCSGCSGCN